MFMFGHTEHPNVEFHLARRRVLTKEIDPKTLVSLSHEDLASKEMAAELDALKKEGVKMVCGHIEGLGGWELRRGVFNPIPGSAHIVPRVWVFQYMLYAGTALPISGKSPNYYII